MKKIKLFTTLMCFLFIIVAGFSVFVNVSAVTVSGIGSIKQTYTRNILDNVTYTYVQSDNNGSPEKNYVLEYDPAVAGVNAMAVYGSDEFGADTITENIALAESQGYTVIAGINASPFDTSNGTTVGVMIQNGKLISAPNGLFGYDSFAINDDGSMFISQSNLDMTYSVNDVSYTINSFNKQKKEANNYVYLLDSDWYSDTRSNVNSCEVVLDITNGQAAIGGVLEAKVSAINESTQKTAIGENQLVLIGSSLTALGNLKVGDELSFAFNDNDTAYDWSKVAQSTCGFYQVLKDGNIINSTNTDVHPRTLVGYKADGTIVFYVVDGRQPGVSMGLTTKDAALYLKSLGCTNVINLDGGGSSNMTIRLPGSDDLTTVNIPSDGEERHDADGILLVLKDDYDTSIGDETLLHAYPNNATLLKNTVLDISVLATDERYNVKDVPEYTMEVIGDCGSITADNKFKAVNGNGTGRVKISSGSSEAFVDITVTNEVDELYASANNLALGPGDISNIEVEAYNNGDLLQCSNEAFTWTCDENIGTINDNGVFTATLQTSQEGYITISYGNISAKVLVTIGQLPEEITGFEEDSCGYSTGEWRNSQVNGGSGDVEINTDLDYVRFGTKSLKINFNLANTTGTVGTQISTGSSLVVPGTPTAIGMWIYAPEGAQGAWIRLQYKTADSTGAKYADFGHIDWTGWKYLEAPFEEGIVYPVSVVYLVRIMGVTDAERLDSTIYVDGLRAVYGFSNDDLTYPTINNIDPAAGDISYTKTQTISCDITDSIEDSGTGINKDATEFYLDGNKMSNLIYTNIEDGFNVSWTPSALYRLTLGDHTISVRCEDNFGNFTVKEWNISVEEKSTDCTKFIALVESINENNVLSGKAQLERAKIEYSNIQTSAIPENDLNLYNNYLDEYAAQYTILQEVFGKAQTASEKIGG